MSDDLHTRLHAAITTRLEASRELLYWAQQTSLTLTVDFKKYLGRDIPGWHDWPKVERLAEWSITQCERDLRVLDRHPPHRLVELGTVPPDPDPPRCWCCHMIYPCSEITDLATVYLETP